MHVQAALKFQFKYQIAEQHQHNFATVFSEKHLEQNITLLAKCVSERNIHVFLYGCRFKLEWRKNTTFLMQVFILGWFLMKYLTILKHKYHHLLQDLIKSCLF